MRSRSLLASLSGLVLLLGTTVSVPAAAAAPVTRVVDDDGRAGPSSCAASRPAPRRIQAAIDRSRRGDTVLVCPGVYEEILSVAGAQRNGLTIRSTAPGAAVVRAPLSVVTAGGSSVLPAEGRFILEIRGADNVRVRGLRLVSPTTVPCARINDAIRIWLGADRALVSGVRIVPAGTDTTGQVNGCGYDNGVAIYESAGTVVTRSTIRDFRLTGILAQGISPGLTVDRNLVQYHHAGAGLTSPGCTKGIGFAGQAGGGILDNQVIGLASAGTTTPVLCTGIYVDDGAAGLAVRRNAIKHADYGIEVDYVDAAKVTGNELRLSRKVGLYSYDSDGLLARGNLVRGFSQSGIWVSAETAGATFDRNDVAGAGTPDCQDTSTGGPSGAPRFGTLNTWTRNKGTSADPAGLCTSG